MAENGPIAAAFAAPGRYIQGRGAIYRVGEVLEQLGSSKPLILLDPVVKKIVNDALESVSGAFYVDFNGECSPEEIDRVAEEARDGDADAVVAVGGGKAIDTAKAVANPAGLPLVIVATIASTDAPTARCRSSTPRRVSSRSTASSGAIPTRSSWIRRSSPKPPCVSSWPALETVYPHTSRPTPPAGPASRR